MVIIMFICRWRAHVLYVLYVLNVLTVLPGLLGGHHVASGPVNLKEMVSI